MRSGEFWNWGLDEWRTIDVTLEYSVHRRQVRERPLRPRPQTTFEGGSSDARYK